MERDVSELLSAGGTDDAEQPRTGSAPELFTALYDELHRLAGRQLRRVGGNVTLSTTTLLHEAYLNLCDRPETEFADQGRFIGYAARVMRGIIIDHIRYTHAQKRGGDAVEVTLTSSTELHAVRGPDGASIPVDVEQLSEALDALAELEPSLAQIVDLHFFCGYELQEIARLKNVSDRTIQRGWRKARLLLRKHFDDQSRNDAK